jgi:hypothetical protein
MGEVGETNREGFGIPKETSILHHQGDAHERLPIEIVFRYVLANHSLSAPE